jgi:hypothetical protein
MAFSRNGDVRKLLRFHLNWFRRFDDPCRELTALRIIGDLIVCTAVVNAWRQYDILVITCPELYTRC